MLNHAREYAERRDFKRMYIDAKVEVVDANGAVIQATARNLSGKGLLFEANADFPLGSTVTITVSSKQTGIPPLHANCKVIRVYKQKDGYYEIAGELSNVS